MRRAWFIALALAALALVAAAVLATSSGPGRRRGGPLARLPSAESAGPRGVAAAAAWLAATGRPWARLAAPVDAPAPDATWLLLAPRARLSEADAGDLLAHAARGRLVVWAMGPAPQPALEAALRARRLPAGGPGERTVVGAAGDPLLDGLTLLAGEAGVGSDRPGAAVAAAGGPGEPPAAVRVPVGRGAVLLLADAALLDNAHLSAGDALSLWVRLAAAGPIAFDERWLALAGPAGAAPPWRPMALAALQALVVAAALLLLLGPRLGAVRPPPAPASRRTAADYLAALAALYQRAGAEEALAADAWRRLRGRLDREAGVPSRLSDGAAAGRLEARWPATAGAVRRGAAALARGGAGTLLEVTRAASDAEAGLRREAGPGAGL